MFASRSRPALLLCLLAAVALLPAVGAQSFPPDRTSDGLLALYTFQEGEGTTIYDRAEVGPLLHLEIADDKAVQWLPGGGLKFEQATVALSAAPAYKIIEGAAEKGEITVEAWIKPTSPTGTRHQAIVGLSKSASSRNVSLIQAYGLVAEESSPGMSFEGRFRSTATNLNGLPSVLTPAGTVGSRLTHVIYTRTSKGIGSMYLNGEFVAEREIGGKVSNWDAFTRLALDNETSKNRPWLGEMHLVAFYGRALSSQEIEQNYQAGPGTSPPRVEEGVAALYTFLEGSGNQVRDVSGVADPLDLSIQHMSNTAWIEGGGLSLTSPTSVASGQAAASLTEKIKASGEVTVEAWIRPSSPFQDGPAAIVSHAAGSGARNVTLAQDAAGGVEGEGGGKGKASELLPSRYAAWLRTTSTSAAGAPETGTGGGEPSHELSHVVFTFDSSGQTRVWVDRRLEAESYRSGDFEKWNATYPLTLGNENGGGNPWLGDLHLVAIYEKALDEAEVIQNYYAGPPVSAGDPGLPRLQIGPEQAFFGEAGGQIQLTAEWIVPPGSHQVVTEASLVWASTNPERVSVDQNGLVTVHMDQGFALITVTAEGAEAHLPGVASVTAGAAVNPVILELDETLVEAITPDPAGEEIRLTLILTRTADTEALSSGDLVVFGNTISLWVEDVQIDTSTVTVSGTLPALNDVYSDLDIDLDADALQALVDVFETAGGGFSPFANQKNAAFENPCDYSINLGVTPKAQLKLKTENFAVTAIRALIELDLGLYGPGTRWSSTLECSLELKPRIPLGYVPLWGVASLHLYGYAKIGVELAWDVGQEDIELDSPTFELSTDFFGGMTFDEQDGLQFPGDVAEPTFDAQPAIMIGEPSDYDISWDASLFIEVGARLGLYCGLLPLDPTGGIDNKEIAHAFLGVSKWSLGTAAEVPFTSFYGVDDERYENPTSSTYLSWDFYIFKEAELGDLTKKLLNFLGVSTVSIEVDPFNLALAQHNVQAPGFTVTENPVYINGGLYYPPNTGLLVDGRSDSWEGILYGTPDLEIWGRRPGIDEFFELKWPAPVVYWTPEEADEGQWEYRAVKRMPFMGAWISDTIPVTVERAAEIKISPVDPELVLPIGETQDLQLVAFNEALQARTYTLEMTEALSWFSLSPTGPITLPSGETETHTVTVDCTGGTRIEPRWVELDLSVDGDPREYRHRVFAGCRSLELDPDRLSFSGTVTDPPVWMIKQTTLTNLTDQAVDWQIDPLIGLPFAVDPPLGTLGAGVSQEIEVRYQCTSVVDQDYDLHIAASAIGEAVPFEVSLKCTDEGGTTWGDPHLITHDGVKYDFHGKGEFVLTRDPSGDFEVQVRQQGGGRVAYNKAVAMRVGGDRVGIYVQPPIGGGVVTVNGQGEAVADGATVTLPGGGTVSRVGSTYTVSWPGQSSYATVKRKSNYISLFVHADPSFAGSLEGLLGNRNGDGADDFALRDGTALPSPPSFDRLYDCDTYRCFAYDDPDGWLIRSPAQGQTAESLFDYNPGESPESFAPAPGVMDPDAPVDLNDYDPQVVAWAQAQCTAAGIIDPILLQACILDIVISGDVDMGLEAGEVGTGGGSPALEVCDGVDNDQDGEIDEEQVCDCYNSTFGGANYALCLTQVSWDDARAACLAQGMDLAKIDSQPENNWLNSWVWGYGADPWIGLTDRGVEGNWLWTDGTTVGWSNWGIGQPSGGAEDCAQHVRVDASWNDLPCHWTQQFVCQD